MNVLCEIGSETPPYTTFYLKNRRVLVLHRRRHAPLDGARRRLDQRPTDDFRARDDDGVAEGFTTRLDVRRACWTSPRDIPS